MDARVLVELADASSDRLRRIAIAAAARALGSVVAGPPILAQAIAELQGGTLSQATREAIKTVASELDQRYLVLQDDQKPGGASPGAGDAFGLARAAAAVADAFDPDPLVAAREGVYEALHAVDDPALIVEIVCSTS